MLTILSRSLLAFAVAIILPSGAFADTPVAATAKPLEAPELGRTGEFAVGTSVRELQLPVRTSLTLAGPTNAERSLGLRFWYPATAGSGTAATYRHTLTMADKSSFVIVQKGMATERAAAAKGKFPLVVISHGFNGWSEQLSRLGEHLASRGYVVVAIDHRDTAFDSMPGFFLSFGKVLIDRALDQRQVIGKLVDPAFAKSEPALASADAANLGLIGYSMGGYGALATSGAAYDPAGKPFSALPEPAKAQAMAADAKVAAMVDAVVLVAPWGGQPDNRAWSAGGMALLKKPVLFVAGDQDDIVNYKEGIRWLFDGATASDRYLLTYREARHNVVGDMFDLGENPSSEINAYLREPVWRQDRLNQINQHFVTAFLDMTLKGDAAKRKYLDVPTPVASDGKWPLAFGQQDGGAVAGDAQPDYWRGFQRRWAVGLELHHKASGQ
jgi:alpha-beta hydrolase superfamily lysophospholipase